MEFQIFKEHRFQSIDLIMSSICLFCFFFFLNEKSSCGPNCRIGWVTPIQPLTVFWPTIINYFEKHIFKKVLEKNNFQKDYQGWCQPRNVIRSRKMSLKSKIFDFDFLEFSIRVLLKL